jgi:hypothetical protein
VQAYEEFPIDVAIETSRQRGHVTRTVAIDSPKKNGTLTVAMQFTKQPESKPLDG